MYSKVKILGHSVHPMLVAFPVAFYTATLVTFIVYALSADPFWFRFATVCNWAGVATAGLAAVPGLIDWAAGIPKGTRAKSQGLRHMILNVLALAAFTISAIVATNRWPAELPAAGWNIALAAIGLGLTLPAGFIGWGLVQKHHVGVDLSPEQERLERPSAPRPARILRTPAEERR